MKPIRTRKTQGIYGAPRGLEAEVGGLPFYRESSGIEGTTSVVSVWAFDDDERRAIAEGAVLVLGILGMEPIPPVSLSLRSGDDEWFTEVPAPEPSDRPPLPPKLTGQVG